MNYRADIDGIRAIAVLTVILFHYGIAGFSGGFVGVDVFFVLSGYLISSIIFKNLGEHRFSFSNFYFRRIRRLFPVFAVVMLTTFLVAYASMLPADFREFGQSLFSSTAYISNIQFFMEDGYFDAESHLKPLLHTWSLSVEEQFYLAFPLLAWLTAKLPRHLLFYFFSVLTVLSLVAAALYIERDASAVFFLYPFRAWEMFLGALLALNFVPTLRSKLANNALASVGLFLILGPSFYYDESTLFPGLSALAPCLGTVFLIHAGSAHKGLIHNALASWLPVFIGKLSYSLYLWHWPVFVLYVYNMPEGINYIDTAIMAAVTFVLSLLTWKFVETPIREGNIKYSNSRLIVFGATAAVSFVLMGIGFYTHITKGIPSRFDSETIKFAEAAGDLFGDFQNCEDESNQYFPGVSYCKIGEPLDASSYTLFWGDSHVGAYKRGYENAVSNKNLSAFLAWSGGCPPVIGLEKDENVSSKVVDEQCYVRNEIVKDLLKDDKRINAVVLVGRWSYYMNEGGIGVDAHNKVAIWPRGASPDALVDPGAFFIEALSSTIEYIKSLGLQIFLVEQPPEFSNFVARKLAIGLIHGSIDSEESKKNLTEESYNSVLERQGEIRRLFADLETDEKVTLIRTHKYFCDNERCSVILNDMPVYFDNNHVSSFGALTIKSMFDPLIEYLEE